MGDEIEKTEKKGMDKKTTALIIGGAGLLLTAGSFIADIVYSLVYDAVDANFVFAGLSNCSFCISRLGMIMFGIGLFFFVSDLFARKEEEE